MIDAPVLTSVKARFDGLDVYDVEPAQLPDVLGQRPVLVFGKWRGEARGQVIVEGMGAAGPFRQALEVAGTATQETAALRHLWARHRIQSLSDQEALEGGDTYKKRITELGLQYSLLTQYTSFLAVDRVVRNPNPAAAPSVDQPSPMPQGVSNLAVGAEVPGTPEPETWGAMAVMLSVLAMVVRRARRSKRGRFTA
jgi:Ca-activated chloride channel family protein